MRKKRRGPEDLIATLQKRQARVAVGPSTVRGLRAPGLADAARTYLAVLPLAQFGGSKPALCRRRLDRATAELVMALPSRGRSWGVARKVLNIFLRDSLYTYYFRNHFGLGAAESFFELPLDSITASHLRKKVATGQLPRWRGVKHLAPEVSEQYQTAAAGIAIERKVARIHLDAYWWAGPREKVLANNALPRAGAERRVCNARATERQP